MSRTEAIQQYEAALKLGQKYYHDAIRRSRYPYPLVLDEILDEHTVAGRAELGIINIPSDLIIGTKSAGRTAALAGNFMPLLNESSEFAGKWITLCEAHLSDEGIRDPIECFEYLGRFYIQEGNKRASVLMSFGAPTVPGRVTRIIPEYSDDRDSVIRVITFVSLPCSARAKSMCGRTGSERAFLQGSLIFAMPLKSCALKTPKLRRLKLCSSGLRYSPSLTSRNCL